MHFLKSVKFNKSVLSMIKGIVSQDLMSLFGQNTLPMTHTSKDDIAEWFASKTFFDGKI